VKYDEPSTHDYPDEVVEALDRVADILSDASNAIRGLIVKVRPSREDRAIRLLKTMGTDVSAIARAVGVNRSTLYRWKISRRRWNGLRLLSIRAPTAGV